MNTQRSFPKTRLYCITASELSLGRSNEEVVHQMLEAGIKLIQYREKNFPAQIKLQECRTIRELCARYSACFIVNDDVELAVAVDADGVHVGQEDIAVEHVRGRVGNDVLIGLSVSSIEEAKTALKAGIADYLGVGPIYPTTTKKDAGAAMGLESLCEIKRCCQIPIVAIGGINQSNIRDVLNHGADCVAIISDIVSASDIRLKIEQINDQIANAGKKEEQ